MAFACKFCLATNGLRGSEIADLPQTEEELYDHIEAVHHIVVKRHGETEKQATERFVGRYPAVKTCDDCYNVGASWAILLGGGHHIEPP